MTKMMQQLGTRPRMFLLSVAAIALMGVSACGDDPVEGNNGANNGGGDAGDVQLDGGDAGQDVSDGGTDGGQDGADGGTDGGEDATDGGGDATDSGGDAGDLCADVTCEAPAPSCDGDTVVSYTGAGTCDPADGTCDFSGVEERTDCAADETCSMAQCIDPNDHNVGVGDLVITEVMQNPSAVNDTEGEYFEVLNTTARVLHLNGLEIQEADGSGGFTVTDPNTDPIEVAANSYFVFGRNADTATNGGVTVDYQWDSGSLGNGSDEIVILNGTDEIDRVEWDNGSTFPDPAGSSMQFGAEYDKATDDNNDGSFWCISRDLIDPNASTSDYGTPGAANVDCTLPTAVISIYDLQDPSSANHPSIGQPVDIDGVVVSAVETDGTTIDAMWVQDPSGGERSGAFVDMSNVTTSVSVGDNVDLEGTYTENYDVTTVVATAVAASSNGATITPNEVDASTFSDPATAEAWEGVLVTLAEPAVTNENPDADANNTDHGEFRVDGALRVDDQLFDYDTNASNPTNCDAFDAVTGVVHYTFGNYKVLPRDATDFGSPTTLTSSGASGTVAIASRAFTPADVCVDNGGTVSWTNSETVDHTATERDPVTDAAAAAPAFDHALSATGGTASETFADAGTYHYLCTIHPAMTGRVIVLE